MRQSEQAGPWENKGTTTLTPTFVDVVAPAGIVAKVWVGNDLQTDRKEGLANLRLILNARKLLAVARRLIDYGKWHCPSEIDEHCTGCWWQDKRDCPLMEAEALLEKITGVTDAQV